MDTTDARNVDVAAPAVEHILDTLDVSNPTDVDRAALRAALRVPPADQTPVQAALIARYMAATCGDCVDGCCHWGDVTTREQSLAAGMVCRCARHAVSVRWRL